MNTGLMSTGTLPGHDDSSDVRSRLATKCAHSSTESGDRSGCQIEMWLVNLRLVASDLTRSVGHEVGERSTVPKVTDARLWAEFSFRGYEAAAVPAIGWVQLVWQVCDCVTSTKRA